MARARSLEPMLATIGEAVPSGDGWTFEPKYDGMRVIARVSAGRIRLITRNAHDKAAQFPEIVLALTRLARRIRRDVVLDGEIVALFRNRPAPFQALQGRFHIQGRESIARLS